MKKILFIAMALVIALGGLGIGYARWTDTVTISGPITTGSVCLEIEPGTFGEINTCPESEFADEPDINWSGWIKQLGSISCPMGYTFDDKPCSDKDVASMSFNPIDLDADGILMCLKSPSIMLSSLPGSYNIRSVQLRHGTGKDKGTGYRPEPIPSHRIPQRGW